MSQNEIKAEMKAEDVVARQSGETVQVMYKGKLLAILGYIKAVGYAGEILHISLIGADNAGIQIDTEGEPTDLHIILPEWKDA